MSGDKPAIVTLNLADEFASGESKLMAPVRLYNGRLQYWDNCKDIWGGYVDAPVVTEEET